MTLTMLTDGIAGLSTALRKAVNDTSAQLKLDLALQCDPGLNTQSAADDTCVDVTAQFKAAGAASRRSEAEQIYYFPLHWNGVCPNRTDGVVCEGLVGGGVNRSADLAEGLFLPVQQQGLFQISHVTVEAGVYAPGEEAPGDDSDVDDTAPVEPDPTPQPTGIPECETEECCQAITNATICNRTGACFWRNNSWMEAGNNTMPPTTAEDAGKAPCELKAFPENSTLSGAVEVLWCDNLLPYGVVVLLWFLNCFTVGFSAASLWYNLRYYRREYLFDKFRVKHANVLYGSQEIYIVWSAAFTAIAFVFLILALVRLFDDRFCGWVACAFLYFLMIAAAVVFFTARWFIHGGLERVRRRLELARDQKEIERLFVSVRDGEGQLHRRKTTVRCF